MYNINDVGCYQDGSARSSEDMLDCMMDHGYLLSEELLDKSSEFYTEALNDELDRGLSWMNEHLVDDAVVFEFIDGDLVLITCNDDGDDNVGSQ